MTAVEYPALVRNYFHHKFQFLMSRVYKEGVEVSYCEENIGSCYTSN